MSPAPSIHERHTKHTSMVLQKLAADSHGALLHVP